jgi:uncharacterized protein
MDRSPLKFFLLVFALSIPVWLIGGGPLPGPSNFPLTLNVLMQPFVPLIAASILVYREEGLGGVRGLLRRAFDYRRIKDKAWYVPIIFLVPLVYLLTYGLMALGGCHPAERTLHFSRYRYSLLPSLSWVQVKRWGGWATPPIPCKNGGAR